PGGSKTSRRKSRGRGASLLATTADTRSDRGAGHLSRGCFDATHPGAAAISESLARRPPREPSRMTDSRSQPEIERVLHSADAAVTSPVLALDPQRIGELARRRIRQRRVATGALGTCCLLVAGYFATRPGPEQPSIASREEPTAAELLAEFDRLNQQFDGVRATVERALASSRVSTQANDPSLVERLQQQTRLAQLQQEVARLEAEVQQQPAEDWQLAWLRSGAKRLALANLDA